MNKNKILSDLGQKYILQNSKYGYGYVYPSPTQDELKYYYNNKFYQESKKTYFEDYERDNDWWVLNYNWHIDELLLNCSKEVNNLRLLDVGSGPGLFLKTATDRGIESLGLEPSLKAYEYSTTKYGLKVKNEMLEDFQPLNGKFDIIHSSLVLEHVLDPLGFISKCKDLLFDGGIISIVVPNDYNIIQNINVKLGAKEHWISPMEHLNYFNKESLRKVLIDLGFEVTFESVTFPIDLFLLMGQNYLVQSELGKKCHEMRKIFEFNLFKTDANVFRKELYQSFSNLGIGRELIVIAKKIK